MGPIVLRQGQIRQAEGEQWKRGRKGDDRKDQQILLMGTRQLLWNSTGSGQREVFLWALRA